jgi:RHS repeat-associated protein
LSKWTVRSLIKVKLTYIQQSGSPPVGDGGDQYTGLDRFGRVIDQRWIKDSSGDDLERVEYGFDRASNRVWRDNTVADALTAKQDEFYTYDGLNQLLTLQRGTLNAGKTGISGTPAWEEDFTIDPTGNWDNYVNQVNGTTTLNQPRTHNAVNEVETISGSSSLMTQNAAGNMSKAPKPTDWSSAYAMTYDAWQRLVKVKSGSTTVAIYVYDGQNRRTTKTIGTTTRHYYYSSAWQILEERLNTTTTADRQFVWGLMALDNLILRDRGSERFYSLQDVFSCIAIVDTSGTVQERYGYNAFGLSRVMDASFNVITASIYDWETRYDNYRFDSESNYYQVRNRYLHPTLGRWLTRDPIGYQAGISLYAYVLNNSLNKVDVKGLISSCNGTPYIGGKKDDNYIIFDIQCPEGCQAQNIAVNYHESALEHEMYDECYPRRHNHQGGPGFTTWVNELLEALPLGDHESGFGGLKHAGKANCAGNSVKVEAWMRSRLVVELYRQEWEALMLVFMYFSTPAVPTVDDMQALYVKHTCIDYDCVKCK